MALGTMQELRRAVADLQVTVMQTVPDRQLLILTLEFAEAHIGDGDEWGDAARRVFDIIEKDYPTLFKHFRER
jgi:hypothetical protein